MNPLDDLAAIRRLDRSDMLGLIAGLPAQFVQGYAAGAALPVRWPRPIAQVVFVGVGGSAISGDLVKALLTAHARVPVSIQRTYTLPAFIGRRTLVIASSYSGETEETLAAYQAARRRRAMLAAVTSGGTLARWAQRDRVPHAPVPPGLPPRAALGYMAATPLGVLTRAGISPITEEALAAAAQALGRAQQAWAPAVPAARNRAKQLARRLHGRLVVVYGADGGWEAVVARWRGQLAENAKALASSHLFPEMNHNEINGWAFPPRLLRQATAVMLQDPALPPRVLRRMAITARIIRASGARVEPVIVPGPTAMARCLSMIALGDALSVYLAILHRVDPTPVARVTQLKRQLASYGRSSGFP